MDSLDFPDADAWESWLEANHADRTEAWLRIGRKNAAIDAIRIGDALDVALCFGWIDGHRKGLDEVSFLQRYSRRRPRSSWSRVNVDKAEQLIADGRMRPAGFAEIDAAKADGRWNAAYVKQSEFTVPGDLAEALAVNPSAQAAFDRLSRTEQYTMALPMLKTTTVRSRASAVTRLVERLAITRRGR